MAELLIRLKDCEKTGGLVIDTDMDHPLPTATDEPLTPAQWAFREAMEYLRAMSVVSNVQQLVKKAEALNGILQANADIRSGK